MKRNKKINNEASKKKFLEYLHQYYEKNKDSILEQQKNYRKQSVVKIRERDRKRYKRSSKRIELLSYLGKAKCQDCGYDKDPNGLAIERKYKNKTRRINTLTLHRALSNTGTIPRRSHYRIVCDTCYRINRNKVDEKLFAY